MLRYFICKSSEVKKNLQCDIFFFIDRLNCATVTFLKPLIPKLYILIVQFKSRDRLFRDRLRRATAGPPSVSFPGNIPLMLFTVRPYAFGVLHFAQFCSVLAPVHAHLAFGSVPVSVVRRRY